MADRASVWDEEHLIRDNGSCMRRLWVALVVPALFLVIIVIGVVGAGRSPDPLTYRIARGRAFLEAGRYLDAVDTLREVQAEMPEHAGVRTMVGIAYLRLHLFSAAIAEFELSDSLDPGRADPWIGLAHARLGLGQIVEATEAAERATELDEDSTEAWMILARTKWLDRGYREAEAAALEVESVRPDDPMALEALLHIYKDAGRDEEFEALIERVPAGNRALGSVVTDFLVSQGEFARAFEQKTRLERRRRERDILESELALARDPARTDLLPQLIRDLVAVGIHDRAIAAGFAYTGTEPVDFEIGKAFWLAGDTDAALDRFRAASARGLHKLSAEIALAILTGDRRHWSEAFRAERVERDFFLLGRLEPLIESAPPDVLPLVWRYAGIFEPAFYNRAVEEGIKLAPPASTDLGILLTMATAYERLGRLAEAKRYLEQARSRYPDRPEPAARRALLAVWAGESSGIVESMEEAVALAPSDAGNLYNLGWLYDQIGDLERAENLYRRAIRASDLSFEAMNNLALILSDRGQGDAARELLERAVLADPGSEAAHFNLARHFADRSEWQAAIENLDVVLSTNPANTAALIEKGRILVLRGDPEEAVRFLNLALGLDPEDFATYMLASDAYEKLGRRGLALAAAEEARRINADDPELADRLSRLGKDPE